MKSRTKRILILGSVVFLFVMNAFAEVQAQETVFNWQSIWPSPGQLAVNALAGDPTDANRLYIGLNANRVYWIRWNGSSWWTKGCHLISLY